MRTFVAVVFTVCIVALMLQAQHGEEERRDNEAYSLYDVKQLLKVEGRFSSGWNEKVNNRLGDRIGVALLKIFDEKELAEPATVRSYLPLIRSAFAIPNLIAIPSDRKPNVTLLLLTHVQSRVVEPALRVEILGLMRELKAKTADTK